MRTKKKKLNRKRLIDQIESIERLLASANHLTDTQARKFALVEVREMLDLLRGASEQASMELPEQPASRNGSD